MKVGENMGKRPYYILYYTSEYDGYSVNIEYIGHNYKAAKARYKALWDYVYQHYFLDEGIEPNRIEGEFVPAPEKEMRLNQNVGSYINDQCDMWSSIHLVCMNTGAFVNSHKEAEYKRNHPNAKY